MQTRRTLNGDDRMTATRLEEIVGSWGLRTVSPCSMIGVGIVEVSGRSGERIMPVSNSDMEYAEEARIIAG
jgi:hypothetical protein